MMPYSFKWIGHCIILKESDNIKRGKTMLEIKKHLSVVLYTTAKAVIEEKTRYEAENAVIPKGSTMTINSESGSSGKMKNI